MRTLQTPGFKPFPAPQAIRADGTALLSKEVLYSVSNGNKKPHLQRLHLLEEPSSGLEPETPSLPWRFWGGTRVHGRASKIAFDLQIGALRRVTRVLACPRVVDLMYPSRTPALLSVLKTDNGERGSD
jgi:hypothetical protein